jgi:CheY-like chemotaxis protein
MKNLKVLVADGNASLRSEIYSVLSRREEVESCRCVSGGAEVLECLNNSDYDVLLLDLVLSQTDGFAVLERATSLVRPPRVIVMTALSQDEVVQKACTFGIYYTSSSPSAWIPS